MHWRRVGGSGTLWLGGRQPRRILSPLCAEQQRPCSSLVCPRRLSPDTAIAARSTRAAVHGSVASTQDCSLPGHAPARGACGICPFMRGASAKILEISLYPSMEYREGALDSRREASERSRNASPNFPIFAERRKPKSVRFLHVPQSQSVHSCLPSTSSRTGREECAHAMSRNIVPDPPSRPPSRSARAKSSSKRERAPAPAHLNTEYDATRYPPCHTGCTRHVRRRASTPAASRTSMARSSSARSTPSTRRPSSSPSSDGQAAAHAHVLGGDGRLLLHLLLVLCPGAIGSYIKRAPPLRALASPSSKSPPPATLPSPAPSSCA